MKLLAELSRASMPVRMKDHKDLFKLRILRTAGYIQATIPLPRCALDGHWYRDLSTVRRLTPLGHAVLRYLGPVRPNPVSGDGAGATGKADRDDPLSFKFPPRLGRLS